MSKKEIFELNFPIPRTHCGIYAGNGNLGAMIWGIDTLNITVNRSDFWDHRGGEILCEGNTYKRILKYGSSGKKEVLNKLFIREKFPENVFRPQRLPVGRFEFIFKKNIKPKFLQLEYESGEITLITNINKKIYINLSMFDNVIIVSDPYKLIKEIEILPSWKFEKARKWLKKYGFSSPRIIKEKRKKGWIIEPPEDPSLACVCEKKGNFYIISLERGSTPGKAWENGVEIIKKIEPQKAIKNTHLWWKEWWMNVPRIFTPDAFYNKFIKYAIYQFGCATSPTGGVPAGLQGPWIEEYQPAKWSGDYHFNVNIQQIYTLGFSIGKLNHILPLFDMLESDIFTKNMRHNAKVLIEIDDGLLLTHAVDDRGFQCGGISAGSVLDPACGGWVGLLYWLYWMYSRDTTFLKERAYPFMRGVMRVYEGMIEEYKGMLSIPLAVSPEYGFGGGVSMSKAAGRDPSYQLACAKMLARKLIEISKRLKKSPSKIWKDILKRLPEFSVVRTKNSYTQKEEKHIGIWENQDLEFSHRHHSHLACIYPFDSLSLKRNKEIDKIIEDSLTHWIRIGMGQWSEWSVPWAAIIQTRMGFSEAPVLLLELWRHVFLNEGMHTVYVPRFKGITAHRNELMEEPKEESETMQLDGTMAGATALIEMIVHFHQQKLHLFKGIPYRWQEVYFQDILVPGPFRIESIRKKGNFKYMKIKSEGGKEIIVNIEGMKEVKIKKKGEMEKKVSVPFRINLEECKSVEVWK